MNSKKVKPYDDLVSDIRSFLRSMKNGSSHPGVLRECIGHIEKLRDEVEEHNKAYYITQSQVDEALLNSSVFKGGKWVAGILLIALLGGTAISGLHVESVIENASKAKIAIEQKSQDTQKEFDKALKDIKKRAETVFEGIESVTKGKKFIDFSNDVGKATVAIKKSITTFSGHIDNEKEALKENLKGRQKIFEDDLKKEIDKAKKEALQKLDISDMVHLSDVKKDIQALEEQIGVLKGEQYSVDWWSLVVILSERLGVVSVVILFTPWLLGIIFLILLLTWIYTKGRTMSRSS